MSSDESRSFIPPWVAIYRHELLALFYGLTALQKGHWISLVCEALSNGSPELPLSRCKEVAGRGWEGLSERLERTRRLILEGDSVRIIWVEESLALTEKRIRAARDRRGRVAK